MDIDKILLNKVKDLEMYKIISNPINNKDVINKLTINNDSEIKDIIRSVITNYVDNIALKKLIHKNLLSLSYRLYPSSRLSYSEIR